MKQKRKGEARREELDYSIRSDRATKSKAQYKIKSPTKRK